MNSITRIPVAFTAGLIWALSWLWISLRRIIGITLIVIGGTALALLILGLVIIPLSMWFDTAVMTPLTQDSLAFWGLKK